jgi:hypothetical protein
LGRFERLLPFFLHYSIGSSFRLSNTRLPVENSLTAYKISEFRGFPPLLRQSGRLTIVAANPFPAGQEAGKRGFSSLIRGGVYW